MATDAERIDFLQEAARHSPTGISLEYVPSVEGEPSGYRFMRKHRIDNVKPSVRDAIDFAMQIGIGQK